MLRRDQMHDYQNEGTLHIKKNTHCALFKEMGLGKTVTTLTAVSDLIYEELEIDKVLVIGPKRVAENVWHQEVQKWEHLKHLKVVRIMGDAVRRKQALLHDADIYTISRDNVPWLCNQYGGSMLPFDMLVIDELSSFKNHQSVRFKALKNVQPCFSRVVGLTGTPAPNGLIDLWSQVYLLDRGERLGKFIGQYRTNFFSKGQTNGHIVYNYNIIKGGEDEIHRRIGDICLSMKAKDYLELPPLVENIVEIKMPEDLEAVYKEFKKEKVLEMFNEMNETINHPTEENPFFTFGPDQNPNISAINAAALSNKLLQFANGAIYDSEKNWHEIHDLKIKEVLDIVDNANSPVLIGWTFRHDMYRLMEALKKYKPRNLKTNQDIDDWNNGEIKVLLMHPASGGHGLNLQSGGNNIIWFGQTWSLELLQQFNARLYRQGQDRSVIVNKLVIPGTMDMKVLAAQKSKTGKQEALMQAVKAIINEHLTVDG